ncbi:hypothetical protein ACJJTC_006134 [Scirpophaga incertulas]
MKTGSPVKPSALKIQTLILIITEMIFKRIKDSRRCLVESNKRLPALKSNLNDTILPSKSSVSDHTGNQPQIRVQKSQTPYSKSINAKSSVSDHTGNQPQIRVQKSQTPYSKSINAKSSVSDHTDLNLQLPSTPDFEFNDLPNLDFLDTNDINLFPEFTSNDNPGSIQSTDAQPPTERSIPSSTNLNPIPESASSNQKQDPTINPTSTYSPNLSDNYSKFCKSNPNTIYDTHIIEHNDNLLKTTNKIIVVPTSLDLDESIPYVQDILSNSSDSESFIQSEKTLHSFKTLAHNDKLYYFLFTKVHHFDDLTYSDIFET